MSYVRIPVSLMSDFMSADGGGEYCYVDDWDATLASFSIAKDLDYFVPVLKMALAENPRLTVMAVPWSAPGWMKDSNHQHGGSLLPENTELYARCPSRQICVSLSSPSICQLFSSSFQFQR